jgi:hypothetical protein
MVPFLFTMMTSGLRLELLNLVEQLDRRVSPEIPGQQALLVRLATWDLQVQRVLQAQQGQLLLGQLAHKDLAHKPRDFLRIWRLSRPQSLGFLRLLEISMSST